jgi:hypothetical protein
MAFTPTATAFAPAAKASASKAKAPAPTATAARAAAIAANLDSSYTSGDNCEKDFILDDYEQDIEDRIETFVPVSAQTKERLDAIIDRKYPQSLQVNLDRDVADWLTQFGVDNSIQVNLILREVMELRKIIA